MSKERHLFRMDARHCVRLLGVGLAALLPLAPGRAAEPPANLLRNADFQDDWLTMCPQFKNHHWNYSSEIMARRDYNPDPWQLSGQWEWRDADQPRGARRLVLLGQAAARQSLNWVQVHNPRKLKIVSDAGNWPTPEGRRSKRADKLVRDLAFRVLLSGRNLPAKAGEIDVYYGDDVYASAPVPEGSYERKEVVVKLPAAAWLDKARQDKEAEKSGLPLPQTVQCKILKHSAGGELELHRAVLEAPPPDAPNLLPHGDFDALDANGYPVGWRPPEKYVYFPPGIYYNFNTWHNTTAENRGPVAADPLVSRCGRQSLKMIMPTGDEKSVASAPIVLNQVEPRLIEIQAWVKTDKLAMLQIDARDEQGRRLDGYNFILKHPLSIGSDDWRLIRQVISPAQPVKELTVLLAARALNGYTLDDTSQQPWVNRVGTIWWDGVRVCEPESTVEELKARQVALQDAKPAAPAAPLEKLEPGEQLLGRNRLTAALAPEVSGEHKLVLEFTAPSGKTASFESKPAKAGAPLELEYEIAEPCPAYTEFRGRLKLVKGSDKPVAESDFWFGAWTTPLNLRLGGLFLRPDQKTQFVRANLGLAAATLQTAKTLRLEIVRRRTGEKLLTKNLPATPDAIRQQRSRIPAGLRDELSNLLLADLDVSSLPVQPFNDPQRNWLVRATLLDGSGAVLAAADSAPFCRLAHDAQQPPIKSVRIDTDNLLYINDQPWMPWGVTYLHHPVYEGPAETGGPYMDLCNLPAAWTLFEGFGGYLANRRLSDANCNRYVQGNGITGTNGMLKNWETGNTYVSSAFAAPFPLWSLDAMVKTHRTRENLDAYLRFCREAPCVVSTCPGGEEDFGIFSEASPEQLAGLAEVVKVLREATAKPVMRAHGGYWNRHEFGKVSFFDIFDPETEPWYPAFLHTDMRPLIAGQAKVCWLRPQMYESVPYERWRYHTYVELIRGCRGWQMAHGPGDSTTFRGLHGEVQALMPFVYSKAQPPKVTIEPGMENMVRRLDKKILIVAATTHGVPLGTWRWDDSLKGPGGERVCVTDRPHEVRDDGNGYAVSDTPEIGPSIHGIAHIADPRAWPKGSKLTQWVKIDPKAPPAGLCLLVKADGCWTSLAAWGKFDAAKLRADKLMAYWFIRSFYRHGIGVLGWSGKASDNVLYLVPGAAAEMGALPKADEWVKLEVPLGTIGAADRMIDAFGTLHENGRVWWGPTVLAAPDGTTQTLFGDHLDRPAPQQLAATRFNVTGLKAGTPVQVLFEDRELKAEDGFFTDDLTGADLYQRFGGVQNGYGNSPVAARAYLVGNMTE